MSFQNKDLSEQIHKMSYEKQQLEVSISDKDEQIKKMQDIINDLNIKINDYQAHIDNNDNKDNKENKENNSQSLTLSQNSIGNEIVNYNSEEINKKNIEDIKKENLELKKKNNLLKEQFDKYKNESQIELSIYKNEFQALKKENEELKKNNNIENININDDIYTPDKYNILCDKNYEKLQWFLLIPKDIQFSNSYYNLIWVEKNKINNIDKFNKFESEIEVQNKTIVNYVKKLEQKEEIINKLNYKLNSNEKNINTHLSNEINNNYHTSYNFEGGISLEKYNIVLNQLNVKDEKIKSLQKKIKELKEHKNKNDKNKNEDIDESNDLGYDKHYVLNIKEETLENNKKENNNINNINNTDKEDDNDNENESENYSDSDTEVSELRNELENAKIDLNRLSNECKILENKIKILKETCSNLLIKMNIPKKFKEEIKEILKLFEFTESEILFIVDKKKQYY